MLIETELYLIKLKTGKKEYLITWNYIIYNLTRKYKYHKFAVWKLWFGNFEFLVNG